MQRHADWYRDSEGRGYPGAVVTVYNAGTSTKPQLYSASGSITSPAPISNPTSTDPYGYYAFAVPNGTYDIHLQGGGMPTTIIPNLTIGATDITAIDITAIDASDVTLAAYGFVSSGSVQAGVEEIVDEVNTKLTANSPIVGATKTKITYDADGLVTGGADATASEIVNVPAGGIAATNVQAAINELDTEKLSDAPSDGSYYTRRNAAWSAIVPVTDGDKGDITVSSSGASWSIDSGAVIESKIGLSDNTTNDVSTAKHGFTPKAPNDTTKFLRGDATWAAPISTGGLLGYQIFTANGSYTKATNNPSFVVVEVQGGGAAGGHGGPTGSNAWGGGAGGYAMGKLPASSLAASETVTVGASVAGRTTAGKGANGNASSFGSFCSGAGGTGGAGNVATITASGGGGAGSGGDLNITGSNGALGSSEGNIFGAFGGSCKFGSGGYGSNSSGNAQAGVGYGSGGGGQVASSGEYSGAGAGGIVIVWEYA